MDWQQLARKALVLLITTKDRIFLSRRGLVYLTAVFLGLGLARFANAMAIFTIQKMKPDQPEQRVVRSHYASRNNVESNLAAIIGGPIFKVPGAAETAGATQTAVQETVIFELVGTLEGHWSYARAVINIQGSKDGTEEIPVGAKVGNTTILSIGREHIWVRQGGRKYKIKEGETNKPPEVTVVAANNNAGSGDTTQAGPGETVTKVLSREEVNKDILGNTSNIYKDASFGPQLENGNIVGYKIHRVGPNHVFYKLGARSGDIISKVNGFTMGDTERMFELWRSMKTASRVQVEVIRAGKTVNYDFHIRN